MSGDKKLLSYRRVSNRFQQVVVYNITAAHHEIDNLLLVVIEYATSPPGTFYNYMHCGRSVVIEYVTSPPGTFYNYMHCGRSVAYAVRNL